MSEHWRELAERIDAIKDHPELVDIQLNRCLLAMARYLIETDRRKLERSGLTSEPSSETKREHS